MSFEQMRWIYGVIRERTTPEFYAKYSDSIYKTIQREYLWLDLSVDEQVINKIIEEYKIFIEGNEYARI